MKHLLVLAILAALTSSATAATQQLRESNDRDGIPITYVQNERYAGTTLYVEDEMHLVYWSPTSVLASQATPGSNGDIFEMRWQHDSGFHPIRNVVVRVERNYGESVASASARFGEAVQTAMGFYPPNVPPGGSEDFIAVPGNTYLFSDGSALFDFPNGGGVMESTSGGAVQGPNDVMSISWKHDPDGAGPLEPVDVTVSTEKRPSESFRSTAKRLKTMVDAAMEVFPANVPKTVQLSREESGPKLAARNDAARLAA